MGQRGNGKRTVHDLSRPPWRHTFDGTAEESDMNHSGVKTWAFATLASAVVGLGPLASGSAFGQPPGVGGRPSTQARGPPGRNPGVWGRVVGPTNDGRLPGGHRPAGFLVTGLSYFGPAAAAGLERGDVVTRVNGRRINTYSD